MKEIPISYSPTSLAYHPKKEIHLGETMPNHDCPERAQSILNALKEFGLDNLQAPSTPEISLISQVHSMSYIKFLQSTADFPDGQEIIPSFFAYSPNNPITAGEDQVGYYSYDTYTPVYKETYQAALDSAACALLGASILLDGERSAYVLTRPPGHHALKDRMGGYCYFNNTAIAAQFLLEKGARKIAILDIDAHHGNGTQDWAWDKENVLFASIHGDPDKDVYPYVSGRTNETGAFPKNRNIFNFPLRPGTGQEKFDQSLVESLDIIKRFDPDLILVSAGFDTHEKDPFKVFSLPTEYFRVLGGRIAQLGLPTLHLQEGGYNPEVLGESVVTYLQGFIEVSQA